MGGHYYCCVTGSYILFLISQPPELSNGESTKRLPQGVVYGVVRRSDPNQQKEMVVYGWSTNQLKEEMNYIKDVSYSRIFCFLFFEAGRRVESEAWMGMLSRHFESLIWGGSASPFLGGDAKGTGIIFEQASLGWLLQAEGS